MDKNYTVFVGIFLVFIGTIASVGSMLQQRSNNQFISKMGTVCMVFGLTLLVYGIYVQE